MNENKIKFVENQSKFWRKVDFKCLDCHTFEKTLLKWRFTAWFESKLDANGKLNDSHRKFCWTNCRISKEENWQNIRMSANFGHWKIEHFFSEYIWRNKNRIQSINNHVSLIWNNNQRRCRLWRKLKKKKKIDFACKFHSSNFPSVCQCVLCAYEYGQNVWLGLSLLFFMHNMCRCVHIAIGLFFLSSCRPRPYRGQIWVVGSAQIMNENEIKNNSHAGNSEKYPKTLKTNRTPVWSYGSKRFFFHQDSTFSPFLIFRRL